MNATTSTGPPLRRLLTGLLAVAWLVLVPAGAMAQQPTVLLARVDGTITPVISDYLAEGVDRAAEEGHAALLVEMDTPGGLDTSMREIVQEFLDAPVPVVVHVTPPGGRAASAGALITFSSHVAAMAPGTTIGAATPVDMEAGEAADEKIINDTAAYAASVAAERGRNVEFAEQTVREARSATAREAVDIGAADLLAESRESLLSDIDGREVTLATGETVALDTADARVVSHDMGFLQSLRQLLADPNLAFLFLSLGTLAIIFEFASPGMGLGGAIGAVLIVLGFFSLAVLPVHAAGLALLVLAGALFLGEVFTPGVGVFAAGGSIALLFSGLFLFEGQMEVDPVVLIPTVVVIGLGAVLAGRLAWRARRSRPVSGYEAFLGRELTVDTAEGDSGQARFEGAWWRVRSGDGEPLRPGTTARVVAVDGITLIVETLPAADAGGEEEQP
ncbi:nodulation protein NfeD [Streptomyces sodiiphilus]|uniref:Nodulation protein NfeD n=1 Tax=Streptomyces sodiiphilus TaxID=226217 RepID=A0ABN2PNX2_9ACTN